MNKVDGESNEFLVFGATGIHMMNSGSSTALDAPLRNINVHLRDGSVSYYTRSPLTPSRRHAKALSHFLSPSPKERKHSELPTSTTALAIHRVIAKP